MLYVNGKKCLFDQGEIKSLGHVISEKCVAVDKSKIEAIVRWPSPCNMKELRGFLGLTGYYRWFVSSYAKVAWPLAELLKKDGFHWNEGTEEAFQKLKTDMTNVPLLALMRIP